MTTAKCISACAAKGYTIAGTEYGQECYCASAFTGGAPIPALECQTMCSGALNERCGGGRRLSTYTLDKAAQPAVAVAAAPATSSAAPAPATASSSTSSAAKAASSVAPSKSASSAPATATKQARRAGRRRMGLKI